MSACDFVFRHAGGCLIDTPDLEPRRPLDVERWVWVATLWQDRRYVDGWAALQWQPGERGWRLPATASIGDLVEFGVGAIDHTGTPRFDRWWGWIRRISPNALVIAGPFEHPVCAERDARATVDELRLSELDAPHVSDALDPVHRPGRLN